MSSSLLSLRDVSKSYFQNQILDKVSLDIYNAEIHGVIGENGAGKTTLMKIIAGVEMPDSGELYLEGQRISIGSPFKAHEYGISIIFQEPCLIPNLNVLENISIGQWSTHKHSIIKLINWKETYSKATSLLNLLGINIDLHTKVSQLSLAEQKMVELARGLYEQSRILILDEATSSFTDSEIQKLFSILQKSKQLGLSILFISHRLHDVLKYSDRISILRDGKLIDTFHNSPSSNEHNRNSIIRKMAGEELYNRYPKIKNNIGPIVLTMNHVSDGRFLKDVNLNLRKGEIIGISGLMGSGRSATAKTLFGLNADYSGEIIINNKKIDLHSPSVAIKNHLFYIPENYEDSLFQYLNFAENLSLSHMDGVVNKFAIDIVQERKNAQEYIDRLSIKPADPRGKTKYFSSGNKQKMLFSMALVKQTRIYVLDEPTKGLDTVSKVNIYNILNEIIMNGGSVIFISSDIKELMGMSDRIYVIANGITVAELSRKDINAQNLLLYATDSPIIKI